MCLSRLSQKNKLSPKFFYINRNILLITVFSIIACALHALVLYTQFNHYVYTSVFKIIIFLLCPLIYFAVSKDDEFKNIFSFKGDKENIKKSFLLGLIVFLFIILTYVVLHSFLDKALIINALSNVGISSGNFFLVFLYIIFINAALEEIFFRGFIFFTIYKMNKKLYAYIYSSILFAFYHVPVVRHSMSLGLLIFCVIGLVIAGLIFNELVRRCKSIIGSIIVHVGANLAINLIVVYYVYI